MKKISTEELYLVYLLGNNKPVLGHKSKKSLVNEYTDIFTREKYISQKYSINMHIGSVLLAFPINTNLPYITKENAYQIIDERNPFVLNENIKKNYLHKFKFIYVLPLRKKNSQKCQNPIYDSFTYSDIVAYVLARRTNKEYMEDIFTKTKYYQAYNEKIYVGEVFYFQVRNEKINVGEFFYYPGEIKVINISNIPDLNENIIKLLKELNNNYYTNVEAPQNTVKKLMKKFKK